MSCAHASPADQRVLRALPSCSSLVAEWGVRSGLARLIQQVVGSLVAKSIGVLAPRPEVGIFDGLGRELGFENLWACKDLGC